MFIEQLWEDWLARELVNYKEVNNPYGVTVRKYLKKGYLHFDNRFWLPSRDKELKNILTNGLRIYSKSHKNMEWWAFDPFVKILLKTPRYKYQNEKGYYDLETKVRPICFASHLDSLIFSYYSYYLTKEYEKYIKGQGFDTCVLAYRSDLEKSNIQFSKEVFDIIKAKGECSAVALDIKGYFDHIDHNILKAKWSKVIGHKLPDDQLKIYKALTRYSYVNKHSILKKYQINLRKLRKQRNSPNTLLDIIPGVKDFEKYQQLRKDRLIITNNKPGKNGAFIGIPQGSPLSAVLSNIFLIDYDEEMTLKGQKEGFIYRRYCDDLLFVCDKGKEAELQEFAIRKIKNEYRLTIQQSKVDIISFLPNSKGFLRGFNKVKMLKNNIIEVTEKNERWLYKPLQYLGFEFDGQDVRIRSSSLSRYFRKMKSRIVKTISMAYSEKSKSDVIFKYKLYNLYTHIGKRNFLTYAYNASQVKYRNKNEIEKEGFGSPAIRKQISRHFAILRNTFHKKNEQRFNWKSKKPNSKVKKKV
ncbi:MAG: reverse transcriptase domain-containing protein [Chitinophagales bacterium]|nr:reverse transcriptase domain-containing protein [Chitinophagales bacterium]